MAQQIGRYQIKRELGQGGMATVYLAFDSLFERQVAIKVLPRQFTEDPRSLQRFEQEAKTVAALEDAAIVPVYDFGQDEGWPYLVMRYMSGGTLGERIGKGQPLGLEEVSRILNRLAPALDLAHEKGIIHRDLKPDNVLFDGRGQPYLADFGIAQLAEATHTVTMRGTPAYMSPEQVEGKQKLDWRSDIYALGVMLFEMLTGRQPYEAETTTGQLLMHVTEPVPDVLHANPELPVQTQAVIDRVMAKDREERNQTAVALAEAVQQLLTVPPVVIEPAVTALQQAEETDQAQATAETVLDTPPEELGCRCESCFGRRRENSRFRSGSPSLLIKRGRGQGCDCRHGPGGLGPLSWFSCWPLVSVQCSRGGGNTTPQPAEESRGAIVAVKPTATATRTPLPPTATVRRRADKYGDCNSPTATLDPNVPPPDPTLGSVWERPQD